jgi:hypothetical protein
MEHDVWLLVEFLTCLLGGYLCGSGDLAGVMRNALRKAKQINWLSQ